MKAPWLPAAAALFALLSRLPGSDIVIQEPRMVPTADLALSDDGRFLATVGIRGQLSVWDTRSGELLETLEGQGISINPAFTSDNRYVSGGSTVWDWQNRRVAFSRPGHDLVGVAVDSARGKIHVAHKTELSQHALADGKELARLPLGEVEIGTISLTDKGELLMLCKKTGLVFVNPDTNQVTRRVDLEYPQESYFTPEQIEKKPELGKVPKRITGLPYGRMDHSRSRFRLYVGSTKPPPEGKPWFRTFAADGSAISEKHPISLPEDTFPWFGDTGKLLWLRDGKQVEVIDPSAPSQREMLPISFSGADAINRIDTDRSGRLIAVATGKGWFCYDGDPGDPQSWKLRDLSPVAPAIAPVVTVRSPHPDGKTMLYGSASGAIGGVTLEPGLPHRLLGKMDKEVRFITAFRDGKMLASTQADHVIFEEGQARLFKGEREIHSTWSCRDFILWNAPRSGISNAKVEVVGSNGKVLDSFTDEDSWPEVHPAKSLVLHFTISSDTERYKIGEISANGRYHLHHEFERDHDTGYFAIPESVDSALLFSARGELHRVDARTRRIKKLRDGVPDSVDEVHPSSDGNFLTVFPWNESRAVVVPLDARKPCFELAKTPAEFGHGVHNWIGYTPNQRGAWMDDHVHLADIPQSYAGLWDTATGKLVARLRVHEDGAALLLLPDGRCHFNARAAGLVKRRKAGETTLSPAESSPEVFEVLAPYLKVP